MIKKIISGGQTGADRAGLDVARHCGIDHGGVVPRGRKAEDGGVPPWYQMDELSTSSYPVRTEKNILDSDGTLIVSHGRLTGGSALTRKLAKKHRKPWIHVVLGKFAHRDAVQMVKKWIDRNGIDILNVAGPRASKDPLIYSETVELLCSALSSYSQVDTPPMFITEPGGAFQPGCEVIPASI